MILQIISIFLGVLLVAMASHDGGGLDLYMLRNLIDATSLVVILIFTAPALIRGDARKDFKRAFKILRKDYTCHLSELRRTLDVVEMVQKQVSYAGITSLLISLIVIMRRLSDPGTLGPYLAVATLTMLYATIFEMFLLPLQLEVKRRIIDYMGEDTDAESEKAAAGEESGNVTIGEENENVTVGGGIEDMTVEKEGENVTAGKEKEKTVIVIQIKSGKDVTVKVDEAAGKGAEETAAGTEEGQI